MKAEIIATGTEILLGEIVDTNTSFLARELAKLGIDIHFTSCVGDNFNRMTEVLRQAMQRSDIIITTGGLGPTQGDITRNVIASTMGQELYLDEVLKQDLISFFSRIGIEMSENNFKQAALIKSAQAIPNPHGTAPGWWVEKEETIIIALPGPPKEMQPMWQNQILPRLQKKSGAVIVSRILKTWGLSESKMDEILTPYLASANPTLALYARQDGIIMRITAKSFDEASSSKMIDLMETDVRKLLGNHIWGTGDETITGVVMNLLSEHGLSLAVGESNTGGFLTNNLSSSARNSLWFRGGIVVHGAEARTALGLESTPAADTADKTNASAIAALAREKLGADIAIGMELIAEQTESANTGQKPSFSKVCITVDTGDISRNNTREYNWRSAQAPTRASQQALFTLRDLLLTMK
jgi:nicotinamide-nucleotide amidase